MPDFPEIFVLRHGQTEWNSAGRYQGRMNSALTAIGGEQADTQGKLLAQALAGRQDVTAFCSPQGRAVDTASRALANIGLSARTDERLCEISFGPWEGLTFAEIARGWPELCKNADQDMFAWNFTAPGGETYDSMYARAHDFLSHLNGPTIIVTHGITSYVLRGIWLGLEMHEVTALPGGQGCVYHLQDQKMRRYPAI